MRHIFSQKGFTIIETLVAVAILMISVAGPLTIAHKGLLNALYARDQIVGSYLAQDAIEFIKNVKDKNRLTGSYWLNGFQSCTSVDANEPTSVCTIDTVGAVAFTSVSNVCQTGCHLYLGPNGYTTSSSGTSMTSFRRWFYIVPSQGHLETQAKVVVVVAWTNGVIDNEIVYESEMFNISK